MEGSRMRRSEFIMGPLAAAIVPSVVAAQETSYDLVTPTGTLGGTLLAPPNATRAVLIVPGSGPVDRDGNSPPPLRADSYRRLAIALAAKGIASVRYDKRGIAASHAALTSEADLRFDAEIDDAALWIAKLRSGSRFRAIGLAGHSEGSLIGMVAVQHARVEAFVSIAGAGFPADVVLRRQLGPRLAGAPELAAANTRILDSLAHGQIAGDVPPALAALYRPSVQPYLISWFRFDPRIEIAKVNARVAIVQGANDVQVTVDDAKALAAARPDAAFALIPKMTHVLSDDDATTAAQQAAGVYLDPLRPIDPALVQAVASAFG